MTTAQQSPSLANPCARRRGLPVPLVLGPLRGYWWDMSSGGKLARHLLGTYEQTQTKLFERLVPPGAEVLDLGANTGYYTLLAARLVGSAGRVVAFEPDPVNFGVLQAHVRANHVRHVVVLPFAIGEESGVATFGSGSGTGTRRITKTGDIEVQVRRLDELTSEYHLAPQYVKIDVEGLELAVLRGGEQLFRRLMPTLFLSTHSRMIHDSCCQLLREWKYELEPLEPGPLNQAKELLCTYRG